MIQVPLAADGCNKRLFATSAKSARSGVVCVPGFLAQAHCSSNVR